MKIDQCVAKLSTQVGCLGFDSKCSNVITKPTLGCNAGRKHITSTDSWRRRLLSNIQDGGSGNNVAIFRILSSLQIQNLLYSGVAQWLGCRSLVGGVSLPCARSVVHR